MPAVRSAPITVVRAATPEGPRPHRPWPPPPGAGGRRTHRRPAAEARGGRGQGLSGAGELEGRAVERGRAARPKRFEASL